MLALYPAPLHWHPTLKPPLTAFSIHAYQEQAGDLRPVRLPISMPPTPSCFGKHRLGANANCLIAVTLGMSHLANICTLTAPLGLLLLSPLPPVCAGLCSTCTLLKRI